MPFTKVKKGKNKGHYQSSSGKIYTEEQVKLYYATEGFKKKSKKKKLKTGKKKNGRK